MTGTEIGELRGKKTLQLSTPSLLQRQEVRCVVFVVFRTSRQWFDVSRFIQEFAKTHKLGRSTGDLKLPELVESFTQLAKVTSFSFCRAIPGLSRSCDTCRRAKSSKMRAANPKRARGKRRHCHGCVPRGFLSDVWMYSCLSAQTMSEVVQFNRTASAGECY